MSFVHWWHSFWNERRRNMYEIEYTTRFRRLFKKCIRRGLAADLVARRPATYFASHWYRHTRRFVLTFLLRKSFPSPRSASSESAGAIVFPQTASRDFPFSVVWSMPNFTIFCPSEASDERKMIKMTFRPRTKCRKRQNLRFAHGRNAKIGKIYVSPTDEMQKTAKSTFRPRAKCKKREKLRFAHGRNAEISKIYVSATAEIQKMAKSTFLPRRKHFFLINFILYHYD